MERIALMVVRLIYIVPGWFYKICHYGKDREFAKYDEDFRYKFLRRLVIRANKAGRITVECFGLENLPEENGYILYPNHQGLFDALIFLQTHGRFFSVIMKKEVKNIFLVKQIRHLIAAKLMDREDIRQSMKVINEVAKEVRDGRNYLIFAEGTRSRNGNETLDFKGGSFKAAYYAKCPIIPVAIIDSYKAFDTHSIKKLTVQIHYLKPLYYDEYKDMKTAEVARYVKQQIDRTIAEYGEK